MESGEQDLEPAAKLYFNAQSLASKLDELSASVVINNPDIIIITETWCNFNIADSILTINGYFIEPNLRIDRLDTANGIGGGILVYLRTGLKVLCLDNNSDFNQFCQFKLISNNASETLTFTVIYRSPNSSKQNTEKLCDIINCLSGEKNIIIGDFNFPLVDWTHNLADSKGRLFLETLESSKCNMLNTQNYLPNPLHVSVARHRNISMRICISVNGTMR